MSDNVLDWPIWEDCPYRHVVPEIYTIRRGESEVGPLVAIVYDGPDGCMHVDTAAETEAELSCPDFVSRLVVPRLAALGACIFHRRHGVSFPDLEREYHRLTELKPGAKMGNKLKEGIPDDWALYIDGDLAFDPVI